MSNREKDSANAPAPASSDSELGFEAALERLQATVKKLESGEVSLEEALKSFEEGVRLSRLCQQHLSAAEQRVELLMKANADGSVDTKPF